MKYYSIIDIGYYRSDIGQKISSLVDRAHFRYKIYHRLNELGQFNNAQHIKDSRNDFTDEIVSAVREVNSSIDRYNKAATNVFGVKKAKKIAILPIRQELGRIFKKLEVDQDGYNLVAPYIEKGFSEFLIKVVDPVFIDLIDHKKSSEEFIGSFHIYEYDKIYRRDLHQLLDIYLMGYKSTSILVLGRIFEKLFTVWGNDLIDQKKLEKTKEEFGEMRFENILGLFKSLRLISDKDWHILSKLRLDRNIGGHYISEKDAIIRSESEKEAEATIRLSLPLLKKYHNKYLKTKPK